jgi:hypothetical protein
MEFIPSTISTSLIKIIPQLRIPVCKVYLSLLLWSMFAFTIFCYLFIPPCLLTHYFVYLTSCYRFIYVLVCFPIKRKTWRTRSGRWHRPSSVFHPLMLFFFFVQLSKNQLRKALQVKYMTAGFCKKKIQIAIPSFSHKNTIWNSSTNWEVQDR